MYSSPRLLGAARDQAERLGMEQAAVHRRERFGDSQAKAGLIEHVTIEVDARSEFDDRDALALQPHHASLGDVENLLTLRDGPRARERDLFDRFHELLDLAFPFDPERAGVNFERRASGEISGIDDLLGAGGDVDEAAGAGGDVRPRAELGDVDRAMAVDLQEREQRHVEAAALEISE